MLMPSKADLDALRSLTFDPEARPAFDVLKYCLIWPDERPLAAMTGEGREFLADLWIVRGFIHQRLPREKWGLDPKHFGEVWEFGLANVAQWPGFRRLELSDVDLKYLARSLDSSSSSV